ncbi:hypothetical protein ACWAT4_21470 [Bradyrhizobium manausense]
MGVDRTDYLMLGADMGGKAFDWDKHQAEIEGAPDARFDLVYDGMCGKYCIAGKIIARSDPYEGFELAKVDPLRLHVDRAALAATVAEAFGRDDITPDDFSLILFSHFH